MSEPIRGRRTNDLLIAVAAVAVAGVLFVALGGRRDHGEAVVFIGRFHPLAVHLPIGFLLLVGVLEAMALSQTLRPRIDPVLALVLRLALASAVAAFVLGLLLASGGGYPERLLRLHRSLALGMVVLSAVSVVTWWMHVEHRMARVVHRFAVGATLAVLGAGAHFGGSMTHGESYLLEHAPSWVKAFVRNGEPRAEDVPARSTISPGEPRVFEDAVLPVLKEKCGSCHGGSTAKGQLRLDSFEALMNGGKGGPVVDAGASARSHLVDRITRSLSADGHMPPEGKQQLTADEIELVRLWIDGGASPTTQIRELLVPDGARRLLLEAQRRANERIPVTPGAAPAGSVPVSSASAAPEQSPRVPASTGDAGARIDVAPASTGDAGARVDVAPVPTEGGAHSAPKRSNTPPIPVGTATASAKREDASPRAFDDVVLPILTRRCGACHSRARPSGGFAITDRKAFVAARRVVPKSPSTSPLFVRMTSPLDDDDHMPPQGRPQPSPAEIDAVRRWIEHGASVRP